MKRPRLIYVSALACLLGWPQYGIAQVSLAAVRGEIHALSPTEFEVVVRYEVSGSLSPGTLASHIGLLVGEMDLQRTIALSNGVAVPIRVERTPQAVRWVLGDVEPGHYEISYRAIGTSGRIPIPAPEFTAAKPKTVQFRLAIPAGLYLQDSFPRFVGEEQVSAAVLSNVPSFVMVSIRKHGQGGWLERVSSAETLTNLLIIGLLAIFTSLWLYFRERART